jgi:integrative and conjugative element protein (TIGR02256 family)
MVGRPKSFATADLVNSILGEASADAFDTDYLKDRSPAFRRSLSEADLVLDFSASPSVLGRLGDDRDIRRAASMFFSPTGDDLVILAEAPNRLLRLDEIEAQYFLSVATDSRLANHLSAARIDFIRYANACQDLSNPVPPWQVQTLSGIGSGQLFTVLDANDPMACVWRLDQQTGSVLNVPIPLAPVHRVAERSWRVVLTEDVIRQMCALREEAKPNETGGILVGSFDDQRAVLHILLALPAPVDSEQSPTFFIRGARSLKPLVEEIAALSAGVLVYIGEWHSHPDNSATRPSVDDEGIWGHLRAHLAPTGAPYLMAISGSNETWIRGGWQFREDIEGAVSHVRTNRK